VSAGLQTQTAGDGRGDAHGIHPTSAYPKKRCKDNQMRDQFMSHNRAPARRANVAKPMRKATGVVLMSAFVILLGLCTVGSAVAEDGVGLAPGIPSAKDYRVQPGDSLYISVWREETLQREVTVQPDGGIRFPLVGEIDASGLSLAEVEQAVAARLGQFIPEPVVSVSLLQSLGNRIYVLGRVNNPGEYVVSRNVDVLQALALAGGMTPFAKQKDIRILRGQEAAQRVFKFNFVEVKKGNNLAQNIVLMPGDTVVVP
jgi:polysaccharide export outer membrane protein